MIRSLAEYGTRSCRSVKEGVPEIREGFQREKVTLELSFEAWCYVPDRGVTERSVVKEHVLCGKTQQMTWP